MGGGTSAIAESVESHRGLVRRRTATAAIDSFLCAVVGQMVVIAGMLSADVLLGCVVIGCHILHLPAPLSWLWTGCGVTTTILGIDGNLSRRH